MNPNSVSSAKFIADAETREKTEGHGGFSLGPPLFFAALWEQKTIQ
jgi:hypothetical protein